MPRRRQHDGPKRHRRDRNKITDLFVTIDKTLVERAQQTAEDGNVNLWEVVEDALRKGLPPQRLRQPEQAPRLDLPVEASRKAS